MFSRSLLPLCVYLALVVVVVDAHDPLLVSHKRLVRKRSPLPDIAAILPLPPVAAAGSIPTASSSASVSASATSASSTSSSVSSVSSASSTSSGASSVSSASSTDSVSASSTGSLSVSSASQTSSSSTSSSVTAAPAQTSDTLNLTGEPFVSTVGGNTVTKTHSVDAASASESPAPSPLSGVAKTKSTTLTVLIAVAASVGGIAILWTIFRKWKLSSSKKFDQRLNPIDWQPTTGDDDIISRHRRSPSGASSLRSGSGHGHNNSAGRGAAGFAPLEHDFTAGPATTAPVGGYADLSRGGSPNMSENISRGPSFNRGYNHAGYGTNETYRY
ncbi:hypothetical protein JR316_0000657 [Psilocybe cubensis]|uniref:Uncharacterized protein n=2 Tax=Psilocybe cubensis TaxID=181762 RepID=A0ACB8HG02_PSICU|nr:hypothetical protein JR316_0000657 [Psilocybe cubensis]KAH9486592.1 hypothetical protein JR316_0000657 [Psilocybe cubensis]